MEPYFSDPDIALHLGSVLDVLPTLPDASVDAVVCDPPYEIGIAGQAWDRTGIAFNVALWQECLRVLKPGGHLIAFGAARTYHRLVCAAEDAGFRVIDQIDWIYTHGKPKGIDLARAIDRRRDDRQDVLHVTAWLAERARETGWNVARMNELFGFHVRGQATHWITQGVAAQVPTEHQWEVLRRALGFDDAGVRPVVERLWARKGTVGESFALREVISERYEKARDTGHYRGYSGHRIKSRAASDDAKQWEGWNTALKPAHDPILLARRGTGFDTLTTSLLKRGVGGLNVAACTASSGGWPANILMGHDCPEGALCEPGCPVGDVGDSVRTFPVFRLESRTPAAERLSVDGVEHLTPKPLALMRWLVRLVTPPSGIVLDPFAGSGTTLEAAVLEGFRAIGVELLPEHADLCVQRLSKPITPVLFGDIA